MKALKIIGAAFAVLLVGFGHPDLGAGSAPPEDVWLFRVGPR